MIKAIETTYNGYKFRSRIEARWAVFFDALGIAYQYELEGFDLGNLGYYLPDFYLPNFGSGVWIEIKGKKPTEEEILRCIYLANSLRQHTAIFWGQVGAPIIEITVKKNNIKWYLHDGAICLEFSPIIDKHRPEWLPDGVNVVPEFCIASWATNKDGGDIDIWPIYISDAELPNDLMVKSNTNNGEKKSVKEIFAGIADLKTFISPVYPNGWMFRSYVGSGRTPFSSNLLSAYKKARSARFEHGETP